MSSVAHRVRAHDVLLAIDEAKAQREQNDTLRNTLLDAEDVLNDLHTQLFARRMYEDVGDARHAANDYLDTYESELSYSATSKRHHAARYMADCSLTVPEDQLTTDETLASQRGIDAAVASLGPLKETVSAALARHREARQGLMDDESSELRLSVSGTTPLERRKKETAFAGNPAADKSPDASPSSSDETTLDGPLMGALNTFFETALERLEHCRSLVESARVESEPWIPVIEPVMQLLTDLVSTKSVGKPLCEFDAEIVKLNAVDAELVQQQDLAIEDGNITENEAVAHRRITLLEATADLVTQKFTVLDAQEDELVNARKSKTETIQAQTSKVLTGIRRAVQEKRKEIQADIAKLSKEKRRAENDEELARSSFLQEKRRTEEMLDSNAKEQEGLWDEIFQLEARLADLAKHRREEVERRVKLVEREERRRVDMEHFMQFVDQHMQLLTATLRSRDAEDNLDNVFEDIATRALDLTTSHFDGVQRQLDELRMQALAEHLGHFKKQYMTVGDLMFKKSRYVDELDKRIEFYVIQQETAMETLDPKARVLTQEKERLQDEKLKVNQTIDVLKEKAALYIEAFKPTEKAIKSHGKMVFVHPLKELQTSSQEKGRKLAAYYALIVKEQNPARDPAIASLVESEHEIQAQRDAVDKERQEYVPYHKRKGSTVSTVAGSSPTSHSATAVGEGGGDGGFLGHRHRVPSASSQESSYSDIEIPAHALLATRRQQHQQQADAERLKQQSEAAKRRVPRVIARGDPQL